MVIRDSGEYYGDLLKAQSGTDIQLSEYLYTAPQTEWHFHEHPYFMMVLQGNVLDINNGSKRRCNPGTLLFLNWQEAHMNRLHSKMARGFHVEVRRNWIKKFEINNEIKEGCIAIKNPKAYVHLSRIYFEFHKNDSLSPLGISTELIELLSSLESPGQNIGIPVWFSRLIDLLHDIDGPVNLNFLSEQLGLHPVHISRTFTRVMKISMSEFVRRIRLKRAIALLQSQQGSLSQIALQSGFYDQSHFTKVFKAFLGQTPGDYGKPWSGQG